jgi:hypothetical protein
MRREGIEHRTCRNPDVKCAVVRISKEKMRFEKCAEQNYRTEIFQITKVIKRRPRPVYELHDLNGMPTDGQYYQEELSPFHIEKHSSK